MKEAWPLDRIGSVLNQETTYITELEPRDYPRISVKWWGEGAVAKGRVHGTEVRMEKHQLAREGQVIVSEIWAKHGSIGIIPKTADGALITSHFFLFNIRDDLVLPKYLDVIFRANYLVPQMQGESKGTTGYASVRPHTFLDALIPLPALPEQRQIVARIEQLASRIAEAKRLRSEIDVSTHKLMASVAFDRSVCTSPSQMRTLVRMRAPDVTVLPEESYRFAGVYCFGRGIFRGDVKQGMEFSYGSLTRLRSGDFVYPKLMAWEGAFGLVPKECDGLVVSPEFPVFEIDEERVLPEVLEVYFKMPSVWEELKDISVGTNVRRRRLQPETFLQYEFPLPPMPVQKRVREISYKLQQTSQWKRDQLRELEGLLPSILDNALRGEL
jgi:type I restriction enzyme, S subunit